MHATSAQPVDMLIVHSDSARLLTAVPRNRRLLLVVSRGALRESSHGGGRTGRVLGRRARGASARLGIVPE
jgi:hypothetical protein